MNQRFKQNRLAEATSPYLLQHKDNPVHWQIWEPEVFAEARRRNVPVLLSIGYAACHWCHVMAHESFEDDEVAALMNENFVCIKLDREERPDLDDIYMSALSMMGEQGGWPLTMCLDADAKPFWGGTYFPKHPQMGRPGFMQILTELSRVWHEAPDKILKNTQALSRSLTARAQADARGDMPANLPQRGAQNLHGHMDKEKGGLSGAPKFPQAFFYGFLWQQAQLDNDTALRDTLIHSVTKMCQGGLYDHIGGGFARYSVDADWLVPHFEKMLYDNALLIDLLASLWRDTKSPLFKTRLYETVTWVLREMVDEAGAFTASLDADTQGEEGKFYVWSKSEIDALLGDAADGFCATYDITEAGNFEGHNIPNLLAQSDDPHDAFSDARNTLFSARHQRIRPGRDDKILADWNGMMIAALARAAILFGESDWLTAARTAFHAATQALTLPDNRLAHSARDGRQLDISLAADYAFMGQAALALFEATGDGDHLEAARHYARHLNTGFWAPQGGYLTNHHEADDTILVNNRNVTDNAMPSANAAAMHFLNRLAMATGELTYRARAEKIFQSLSGHLATQYPSMTALLSAHQEWQFGLSIFIVGPQDTAAPLLRAARRHKIAHTMVTHMTDTRALHAGHPAFGKTDIDGAAAAYICTPTSCRAPVTSDAALTDTLDTLLRARQRDET